MASSPSQQRGAADPIKHLATSIWQRLVQRTSNVAAQLRWRHLTYRACAYSYIFALCWIVWRMLPVPGHWSLTPTQQRGQVSSSHVVMARYFQAFRGFSECDLRGTDLYDSKMFHTLTDARPFYFCPSRKRLLQAMSGGGRVGFDAPYIPRSCDYHWFDLPRICMVLERFDSIIFIGDEFLHPIYAAFNILLRQDLMHGALQTWSMDTQMLSDCKCDNQFKKASCIENYVASSDQVTKMISDGYICQRKPHAYLKIGSSGLAKKDLDKFSSLAPHAPRSNYKHIPIIFSVSPSTSSVQTAVQSLLNVLKMADDTGRKTDMLFIGPSAAGHIDIKGRKGNQEIWDFHQSLAKAAHDNDIDVLGVWNLTVQANSWDGIHFGQKVAITQAMMVINWLARLESS